MATIQEHIKATGKLNILVTGADGKVKQDLFVPNLVVSLGKDYIAGRMKNTASPYQTPRQMAYMAVGEVSESYNYGIASSVSQFGPFTYNSTLAAEIASSRTALTTAGGTQGVALLDRTATGTSAQTISGVAASGTGGQFTYTSSTTPLVVGQTVTITGTESGTGDISGYTTGNSYKISAVGSLTFTLTTTAGAAITTTAGTLTGLTFTTTNTQITVSSYTNIVSGMYVHGQGIPAGTKVSATPSSTTVQLDAGITANLTSASATATGGDSGAKTITVDSATGISVGQSVSGTGIGLNAKVHTISGTTITLTVPNSGAVSGTIVFAQPVIFTNANTITYACTFLPGVGTGAIVEAGIFNDSTPSATEADNAGSYASAITGGTMLCRTTFAVVNKGADDTMSITWTVTIS